MIEKIITTLVTTFLVAVLGGLSVFFGWDVAVDKYLIPHIEDRLIQEKYIRNEIKNGQFVSTNKESFNTNHVIDAKNLISLKNGEFVTQGDLTSNSNKTVSHINAFKEQLKIISDKISVLTAKDLGEIKLKIYVTNDRNQKGTIVLNKRNRPISTLIGNNISHKVRSLNGNEKAYTVRIQNLNIDGKAVNFAIANLFISDYHDLFESARGSGIGTANIYIR